MFERYKDNPEKLNADLVQYVERCARFTFLRSPFLVMPYAPGDDEKVTETNAFINAFITYKAAEYERLTRAGNYDQALALVERPFRLSMAVKFLPFVDDAKYWDVLSEVWTDSEFPSRSNEKAWTVLFGRKGNPALQSDEFNALPERITVYRGGDVAALSWTTSLAVAKWFASRFGKDQKVWKGEVNKTDILHMTNYRNELEIVVSPYHVQGMVDAGE